MRWWLPAAAGIAACSGGIGGTDAATNDGATGFASVEDAVVTPCVPCHTGSAPSGGLDLSGDAYAAIVGVPSLQVPTMSLVEPGDSLHSYLWHKINGSQSLAAGSGTSMPQGGSLTEDQIQRVADWIDAGAPE